MSKLCASNKSKKVEFSIREITQGSKKKTYGPYLGEIEKLAKPIELKGRVIKYKPVAKLSGKKGVKSAVKKGGMRGGEGNNVIVFLFTGTDSNIDRFLNKRTVRYIAGDLTSYFRKNNTGINSNDITTEGSSNQILFNSLNGKTSDTFPKNLFETDQFKELVRLLQVLLNRWKLVNTNFSIFISKGGWDKSYSISNATSEVKTYGALNDAELTSREKNHNYGRFMNNNLW